MPGTQANMRIHVRGPRLPEIKATHLLLPSDPLISQIGGHLTPEKVTSNPQKGHSEGPGKEDFLSL